MRVYLKLPDRQETPVNVNLVPKAGENVDYGGVRYVVVSVVHTVETAKTVLELARVQIEEGFRTLQWNQWARYRTSEIRAFSPVFRPRIGVMR